MEDEPDEGDSGQKAEGRLSRRGQDEGQWRGGKAGHRVGEGLRAGWTRGTDGNGQVLL